MGEVYRAVDTRLKREVALKVLPQALRQDRIARARFEQEARTASALNHPNIVCIYDIGDENNALFLVSELVAGEPLRNVISRGPLHSRRLLDIGQQIADGLAAAHSAGIIHRDLKPENILITRDGRVKIIDFGLAKQLALGASADAAHTQTLTMPGMIMGTIGYMSPEQIRAQPVDARTDLFSFGVILYEMAGGKTAFTGTSGADVMSAILTQEPPELHSGEIPAGLSLIIRRCLEKDPARRFQTASDLAFAIRNLSAGSAAPIMRTESSSQRLVWWKWAVPLACVVAAALYWMSVHQTSHLRSAAVAVTPPISHSAPSAASAPPPAVRTPGPSHVPALPASSAGPKTAAVRREVQGEAAKASEAPPDAGSMFSRGQQLNKDGEYSRAVEAFNEAIRRKPDHPAAYVGRGNAYFFLQQFDRAIEDYNAALKIQPGFALAYAQRGRAYIRQKQFDRALEDLNEAIRLNPKLTVSYVDRGRLYNQRGEYQKALDDFDHAIQLNPELVNAYAGRAVSKSKLGDTQGAAADRQQAKQLRQ